MVMAASTELKFISSTGAIPLALSSKGRHKPDFERFLRFLLYARRVSVERTVDQ